MLPHEDAVLNRARLFAETPIPVVERAGILLPLPLTGPYDYKLPRGINAVAGHAGCRAHRQPRKPGRGVGRRRR